MTPAAGRSKQATEILKLISEQEHEESRISPSTTSTMNVGICGIQEANIGKRYDLLGLACQLQEESAGSKGLSQTSEDVHRNRGGQNDEASTWANIFAFSGLLSELQANYLEAVRSQACTSYACFPIKTQRKSKKVIEKWVTETVHFTAKEEEDKAVKAMIEGAAHAGIPHNAPILHKIRSEGTLSLNLENKDLVIPETQVKPPVASSSKPTHPLNAHTNLMVYTVTGNDYARRSRPKAGSNRKHGGRNSKKRQECHEDEDSTRYKTFCICAPSCPLPSQDQCSNAQYLCTCAPAVPDNCNAAPTNRNASSAEAQCLSDPAYQSRSQSLAERYPSGEERMSANSNLLVGCIPNPVTDAYHPSPRQQNIREKPDDCVIPTGQYTENRTTGLMQESVTRTYNPTYPGGYQPTNLGDNRPSVPAEAKEESTGFVAKNLRAQPLRKPANSVKRDFNVQSSMENIPPPNGKYNPKAKNKSLARTPPPKQPQSSYIDRSKDASVNSKRIRTKNTASSPTPSTTRLFKAQSNQTISTVKPTESRGASPIATIGKSASAEAKVHSTSASVLAKLNQNGGSDSDLKSTATAMSKSELVYKNKQNAAGGSDVKRQGSQRYLTTSTSKHAVQGENGGPWRARAGQVNTREHVRVDKGNDKVARAKFRHNQTQVESKDREKVITARGRGGQRKLGESPNEAPQKDLKDTTTQTASRGAGIRGGGHLGLVLPRAHILSHWFKLSAEDSENVSDSVSSCSCCSEFATVSES